MGRAANLSPLGLYRWDESIFDLMQIPQALDRNVLIDNLLAETAELEVLYPNPVVFKNLVGVWSQKNIDVWNRLYATTQYDYNPIENYNRYETGSDGSTGTTTHSGTDTTTETTTHGGTDGRTETLTNGGSDRVTEALTTGGKDTLDMTRQEGGTQGKTGTVGMEQGGTESVAINKREGGTETENTTSSIEQGGQDEVTGTDTKGHWIAAFDSTASGQDDGLVKQTRDQDDANTVTEYGKTEDGTGTKTTQFGKTNTDTELTTFGKTEDTDTSETVTFGKTETNKDETTYGKTENTTGTTTYGKTESVQETKTYGETIGRTGGVTHGEQVETSNEGEHTLHAHGNIGVTTTQKLIREQRSIDLFNLYDIIIEDFKMRFCILVY